MRINLEVPYEEKDKVKCRGAKWSPGFKKWYVTDLSGLIGCMRWVPERLRKHLMRPYQEPSERILSGKARTTKIGNGIR